MTSFRWTKISSFIPDLEGVYMRPEMKFHFDVKKKIIFTLVFIAGKFKWNSFLFWSFNLLSLFCEISACAYVFFRMVSFWGRVWNFISVKITVAKQQPQWVSFRLFHVNSYKRFELTPNLKYFISHETKSHVNILLPYKNKYSYLKK